MRKGGRWKKGEGGGGHLTPQDAVFGCGRLRGSGGGGAPLLRLLQRVGARLREKGEEKRKRGGSEKRGGEGEEGLG